MKSLTDILNTPLTKPKPPKPPRPTIEGTQNFYIPRSGWSGFFIFLGCIGILVAGISIIVCINADYEQTKASSITLIIAGFIVAIQSFFLSFLINVFTDIRWFLSQMVEKQKEIK
jgi:hypothetical protein